MIKWEPDKLLKKLAPASKIKKLLTDNISLKKTALKFVDAIDFLDRKDVEETALKVIKGYKARIADDPGIEDAIKADPAQLIQRVQNQVVWEMGNAIKSKYQGEQAIWLPSDADDPRPEHQLNYGEQYTVGEGIDGVEPGDEYGCRCGIQLLVDDSSLEL